MPEVLEVELYRRLASTVVGRRVTAVGDSDSIVVSPAGGFDALVGSTVESVQRRGKYLAMTFVDLEDVVVLHFGMTGRLIVDGRAALESLVYGASDNERWVRFSLTFDQGDLVISDPRRFSRVRWQTSDPFGGLGPDAMSVGETEFVLGLEAKKRRAVKAALLDQKVVAGLGNMLVDEILLRAGIDPRTLLEHLQRGDFVLLHQVMVEVLPELLARGGSHTGLLASHLRTRGALCPLDAMPLVRLSVAGRTTFLCPAHQRLV